MDIWQLLAPFNQQCLLLVVVIAIHLVLQKALPHDPWRGFRFYCQQLAAKVNKPENGANQQIISGIIATVITFLPLWLIAWLFESLVALPELYQSFLLYLSLGFGSQFAQAKVIAGAITNNDNYSARQTLAPMVLRETDNLSALGINKATIEMQSLSYIQGTLVPIAIFLVFGPVSALSYRLILEMHYSWNTKLATMQQFGRFTHLLVSVLTWLPTRIFTLIGLLFSLGKQFWLVWRLISQYFFKLNNNLPLSLIAYHHNIRIAGVAMYQGRKLRRASFNDRGRQPEATDIIHVQRFLIGINVIMALTLMTFALLIQLLSL